MIVTNLPATTDDSPAPPNASSNITGSPWWTRTRPWWASWPPAGPLEQAPSDSRRLLPPRVEELADDRLSGG